MTAPEPRCTCTGAHIEPCIYACRKPAPKVEAAEREALGHRIVYEKGLDAVCSCGLHLSVYGLTRSIASVFAEHVRDAVQHDARVAEAARAERPTQGALLGARTRAQAMQERAEAAEAKLLHIEALADEWERTSRRPCNHGASALELRAALEEKP